MGEIYRARDTRLPREVALKTLPEPFALGADRRLHFEREAHVLATLNPRAPERRTTWSPDLGSVQGGLH